MDFLKNEHGCERNFRGWIFGEWGREMVQQIISDEDHDCFGRFSNTFASEGSPIFLPTFGSVFSKTTSFVLKMIIFLIHGLGKCKGVGEDSRHGDGM